MVQAEVLSIDRTFDVKRLSYSIAAKVKLRCPRCRRERLDTREVLRIPLHLLAELATCQECWGPCVVLASELHCQQVSAETDIVSLHAVAECRRCKVNRALDKSVRLSPHKLIGEYCNLSRTDDGVAESVDAGFQPAVEVLFSYSHQDSLFREDIERHLSLLKREGLITTWHDRKILPGSEWETDIDRHIESAAIILLLISADFIASDYCYSIELEHALARHARGLARVIPIIVRPADWHGSRIGELQALPTSGRPISAWPNRDEALLDVANGVRRVLEEMRIRTDSEGRS
jgi:hypothetical protein